ncbi:hypothetical protein [Streptomyces sp. CNQ085]|uniref:hypothetical protein n=1 Tax=Streptomyces sp. CNQ085 TaxID=2886944 RepID=UPI001F50E38D|nr:hypothetical protein [Streptomyces sp. CNQ085]MCI0386652.1 hypothetical protein [Streptomyces sp. CNQ085]
MSERTARIILTGVLLLAMWGIVAALPEVAYVVVGVLGCLGWQRARSWLTARRDEPGEDGAEAPAGGPGVPELVAAMHDLADPHVHLSALAQALGFGKDTAPVRRLLAEAGVPTKAVRMSGRTSTGVDRAAFPPLPSPPFDAPESVVAAGQSNNSNSNNALVVERGEGMTIIREPVETASRRSTTSR